MNGIQDQNLKQKLLIDPPVNLEGAVQYYEHYVTAKSVVEGTRKPFQRTEKIRMVRPYEEEEDEEEEDDIVDEVVNFLRSKGVTSRNRDFKNFKCYNCGMTGHMRKTCRVKCPNCGGAWTSRKRLPVSSFKREEVSLRGQEGDKRIYGQSNSFNTEERLESGKYQQCSDIPDLLSSDSEEING